MLSAKKIWGIVAALAVLPAAAGAVQLFDFTGQALVPTVAGEELALYSIMNDPYPDDTPIPLDFGSYEYTLVLSGCTLTGAGNPQVYTGGTLTIYEDAGTAADYADPTTFTDGTAILVGHVPTLTKLLFPLSYTLGNASGDLVWTGGTRLDDIAPEDQVDWVFLSGTNKNSATLEPGYQEVWTGKAEPPHIIVDREESSFGSVKALFK